MSYEGDTSRESTTSFVVVMDSYGGDWTPFAVFRELTEANRLKRMLEADASSRCVSASYYADKDSATNDEPSEVPSGVDSVSVAFDGVDVHGVSDDDWVARELQVEHGGLRTGRPVYDTADEVVSDQPAAAGRFIDSDTTAGELLDDLS